MLRAPGGMSVLHDHILTITDKRERGGVYARHLDDRLGNVGSVVLAPGRAPFLRVHIRPGWNSVHAEHPVFLGNKVCAFQLA